MLVTLQGASSHKFSSGSHAEGRIAAKAAIRFILDNNDQPAVDMGEVEKLKTAVYAPLQVFEDNKGLTTDITVNPNYILPKQFHVPSPENHGRVCGWCFSAILNQQAHA